MVKAWPTVVDTSSCLPYFPWIFQPIGLKFLLLIELHEFLSRASSSSPLGWDATKLLSEHSFNLEAYIYRSLQHIFWLCSFPFESSISALSSVKTSREVIENSLRYNFRSEYTYLQKKCYFYFIVSNSGCRRSIFFEKFFWASLWDPEWVMKVSESSLSIGWKYI